MGILWEFPRGNPIGDLIRYTFDFEWLHNDAINIYTFLCNYNIKHRPPARPPVGFPWEWKFPSYQLMDGNGKRILYIGNSHLCNPMGILWELSWKSCVSSHMGILVGILWEFPWESCGNSHGNPVGILWEFPQKNPWEWDGNGN